MALDEVNSRVGDFRIEYRDEDDATASAGNWTPEQESSNAIRRARNPDVMVYIGPLQLGGRQEFDADYESGWLADDQPRQHGGRLDEAESRRSRRTGRLSADRQIELRAGSVRPTICKARSARNGPNKWGSNGFLCSTITKFTAAGLALLFIEHCEEIGIEVVGQDSVDSRSLEFRPLMTAIKAKKPDLIYFGGTTQSKGGQIAKDMVAVGMNAKLMVPDGCMESAFIESAGGRELERSLLCHVWRNPAASV